jgi:hypothetical protein
MTQFSSQYFRFSTYMEKYGKYVSYTLAFPTTEKLDVSDPVSRVCLQVKTVESKGVPHLEAWEYRIQRTA